MNDSRVADSGASTRRSFVRRMPVAAFLVVVFGIGWPTLTLPLLAGQPQDPFLLVLVFGALLAAALFVTRIAGGPGAKSQLLARTRMWRFGATRWAIIVLAVPAFTVGFAAASGTLSSPEDGILLEAGMYLFNTLIFGALILNVWEEAAWGGFAQSRLMARHGLLVGSLLTAPLFAAIHIPLLFAKGWTWSEVGVGLAVLCAAAPFYRHLLGIHLLDTGGSILAIGLQHAAWNASGSIDGIDGEWQAIAAVGLLTVLLALGRRRSRDPLRPQGLAAEKAAAAGWTDDSRKAGPPINPTVVPVPASEGEGI